MPLKTLAKIFRTQTGSALSWIATGMSCLAAASCVSSSEPVLRDAKAILGVRGQLHVFSAPKNGGRNEIRYRFQWTKDRYVTGLPGRSGVGEFTAHPFEGRDLVVQWKGADPWSRSRRLAVRQVHYFLARKVAEGAYLLIPIGEDVVDDSARKRFCVKSPETACRISTPEQLFVFARATAEREDLDPGIAIIVPARPRGKKR